MNQISQRDRVKELMSRSPYSWLRERDIDILVCSELHAKGALAALFASKAGCTDEQHVKAWVSHSDVDGESDLVALFSRGDEVVLALIENKIAAEFQPEQSSRYRRRAEKWSTAEPVMRVVTILFAPAEYMSRSGAEGFDAHITYEEACEALKASNDGRSVFLAETLVTGVENYHRGYVMVPDPIVTAIWTALLKVTRAVAPKLVFPRGDQRPSKSTWVYFRQAELANGHHVSVAYKADRGHADLQFGGVSHTKLAAAVDGLLDQHMSVVKAGKSASIRINIPKLNFSTLDDQEASMIEGVTTCDRLRLFYAAHGRRITETLKGAG